MKKLCRYCWRIALMSIANDIGETIWICGDPKCREVAKHTITYLEAL